MKPAAYLRPSKPTLTGSGLRNDRLGDASADRAGRKIRTASVCQPVRRWISAAWLPIRGRAYMSAPRWGHVAEWLRNGLQNRVHQFNSGRGLHPYNQWLKPIIGEVAGGQPRSAGGVPALGKRHQRPGGLVVV